VPRTPDDLLRAAFDAVSARDADALAALTTEDFEFRPAFTGRIEGDAYVGVEGIRRYLHDAAEAFRSLHFEFEETREFGDHVWVAFRLEGQGRESDAPLSQRVGGVMTQVGDRMRTFYAYADPEEALAAAQGGNARPAGQMPRGIRIAPSILAADFGRLRDHVGEVLDAGARVIHVDVMDGHFVPPITIGPLIVSSLREQAEAAGAALDVHLMIEAPERQIATFADAGADSITIHQEATAHLDYALGAIREAGCGAGVAINPATPPEALAGLGEAADLVLCMTVNPGWGGQPFIERSVAKLRRLAELIEPGRAIEVDGGIDAETAPGCAAAGATLFVAGSAIFGAADPGEAYRGLAAAVGAE
jgi:ribulose-phosphate 3-epimerase